MVRSVGHKGLVFASIALAGLLAGAFIWLATDVASRSDLSWGGMTLRGNGALILPMLGLPLFIGAGIAALVLGARHGAPRAAIPAWPLAVIAGFVIATANLPALRASAEVGRVNHTATRLPDGRVLVTGGGYDAATAKAVLYDPVTNEWSPVADMSRPRVLHAAVALPGSRVLVIGGTDPSSSPSAEVFDSASGTWTTIEAPPSLRFGVKAVALADGRVFALGSPGRPGGLSAEIYDPRSGSWRILAAVQQLQFLLALDATPDGAVLAVGGGATQAVLIRNGDVTSLTSNMSPPFGAVPLGDGRILVLMGPQHGEGPATAAIISASARIDVAPPTIRRYDLAGIALPDGSVLVAGGNQVGGSPALGRPVADAELLDLATGRWSMLPPMNVARTGHTYTLLTDGRVLVIGGASRSGPLASAEIFDLRTRSWTLTAPIR